jgi:hypothetical protein
VSEYQFGNIFVRRLHVLNKGEKITGHTHNFDHVTFIPRGRMRVERSLGDICESFDIGSEDEVPFFETKAEWRHEMTSLEDGTNYYCVYARRDDPGAYL